MRPQIFGAFKLMLQSVVFSRGRHDTRHRATRRTAGPAAATSEATPTAATATRTTAPVHCSGQCAAGERASVQAQSDFRNGAVRFLQLRSINLRPNTSLAPTFSCGVRVMNAAPGGSQQYRAPMCVLNAPGVARAELFTDSRELLFHRQSLDDRLRDIIVLDPWSLFVVADERLRRSYGCQAEHRGTHELVHSCLHRGARQRTPPRSNFPASVRAAARLTLLLPPETLRVEGAGRSGDAGENRQGDERGKNDLHGCPHLCSDAG